MSEIIYGRSPTEVLEDQGLALLAAWESLGYAMAYVPEPKWLEASTSNQVWLEEANKMIRACFNMRVKDPRYWAQQRELDEKAMRVRKILMAC